MKLLLRQTSRSVSRSPGAWLALLLLFVVLVPAVGLLWLMNQAVANERAAVRQRLIEAYRAQLIDAQGRIEQDWTRAADALAAILAQSSPAATFAYAVHHDLADAIACFDEHGRATYPESEPPTLPSPPPAALEWRRAAALERDQPAAAAEAYGQIAKTAADPDVAARAWQASARSLERAGDRPAALALLTGPLQDERLRLAQDVRGRLIVPNAELMALELSPTLSPAATEEIRTRLRARVLDYDQGAMPAAQRRFLLRELGAGESSDPAFRLFQGEQLAARYLEVAEQPAHATTAQPTSIEQVWQRASTDGRVVLLDREDNLRARLLESIRPRALPGDVQFDLLPPSRTPTDALLAERAGPMLPSWQLVIRIDDLSLFDTATDRQVKSYGWIVALTVLTIVVFAGLAWGLVRRQVALTQLRNDLVANVTHELKTPLASMRLLVETLLHTPQLHEQTTREYLQLIATENLRLSRLIGNFLTFSRIERNKYTFDFKTVSAQAMVDDAVAAVRDRFQGPGCKFEVTVTAGLPPVTADADAFVTALVNLLDNAWKYSDDVRHIALTAGAQNGCVTFAVRDNGIGLSARDAKRIFQRFYQVKQTQSTSGGGSGLGLSIVQSIVSAHRGTVRVESEPACGSTFTITLPAAAEPMERSDD